MDGKSRLAVLTFFLTVTFPAALRADTADDHGNAGMARRHIPGVALAVVRNGRIERAQGYGGVGLEHIHELRLICNNAHINHH